MEFFKKIGEELLKGAEAIAKLADRLKNSVEYQAARIAKAYNRLAEFLNAGETEKADRLKNKIDRRVDRLQNTVEKYSSRINELANNQTGKLTNILKSQAAEGQSSEASQANGTGAESETTETPSQDPSGEEDNAVTP